MSKLNLWLIVLIEGFVTISAEILTIRQILPIAGGSVIVTSLIIGIFLLFLAYGYKKGGEYKTHFSEILKRNFTWAAFFLGIGLSYAFIQVFFTAFQTMMSRHLLIILTLYLLAVTAPMVYILGQTVPITMNLIRREHTIGAMGGKILHLSTIGSFLGSVITSLFLMNTLGVAVTILINFLGLMFLSILLIKNKRSESLRILILITGLCLTYLFNVYAEKRLFVLTNSYANYQVSDLEEAKVLSVNGSPSSYIDKNKKAFPYIEIVKRFLFTDLKLTNQDILVLGAGGFTLSAENTFGNRFVYLDIDPDIEKVAKEHFIENIAGQFIIDDARNFLNTTPDHFDVIFSDVYSSSKSIPAHLLTQEYFATINRVLKPNGLAVVNIIAKPTMDDAYSQKLDNTIRSVFGHCMIVPTHYKDEAGNILYFCQKNPTLQARILNNLYTDDLNQSTFDFYNLIKNLGNGFLLNGGFNKEEPRGLENRSQDQESR